MGSCQGPLRIIGLFTEGSEGVGPFPGFSGGFWGLKCALLPLQASWRSPRRQHKGPSENRAP